jgi:hypothetical protein
MDIMPLDAAPDSSFLLPTVISTNRMDARTVEVGTTDSGVIYDDKSLKNMQLSMWK